MPKARKSCPSKKSQARRRLWLERRELEERALMEERIEEVERERDAAVAAKEKAERDAQMNQSLYNFVNNNFQENIKREKGWWEKRITQQKEQEMEKKEKRFKNELQRIERERREELDKQKQLFLSERASLFQEKRNIEHKVSQQEQEIRELKGRVDFFRDRELFQ